jgi:hypothetical protein
MEGLSISNPTRPLTRLAKGTSYTNTPSDLKYCIAKGSERWKRDKEAGIREQKYEMTRSGIDLDISGFINEFTFSRMINQDNKERLDDTTPQGIRNDRGDVVVDGAKIDIKGPIGHYCDIWVRKNSQRNPSQVYVLLTMNKRTDALPTKRPVCENEGHVTFHPDENITPIFQGAVCAYDLFQPEYMTYRKGQPMFVYPQKDLLNLEDAIARWKDLTPEQVKWVSRFKNLPDLLGHVKGEGEESGPPAKKRKVR